MVNRRWARFAFLTVVLAVLTACDADVRVTVDVEEDGSGVVVTETVLDAEATEAVIDLEPEAGGLPLSDLAYAGWIVESPTVTDDGTTIRASKEFGTIGQFSEVMDELSAESGMFQDFALTKTQSFGRLSYGLTGTIDTSAGFEAFSDEALEETLGRSITSIADYYGAEPGDISVVVEARLPGELQEDTSTGTIDTDTEGEVAGRWGSSLGTPGRVDVVLNTTRRSITAQVLRGLAVVAGVLAGLLVFARLVRWISGRARGRSKKPKVRPADALGRSPEEKAAAAAARSATTTGEHRAIDITNLAATSTDRPFPYEVVAIDGMGVLYKEGDDIRSLLIPFARDGGSVTPAVEIAAKARLVSLGRITSADFWKAIGVKGDPNELDVAYLANHQLMPGVVRYLRRLRDRGVKVACITNDGTRWATKLRSSHSLENLIDQWVVSGSVGVRKPDAPIFEVLRRVCNAPAQNILVIDDDLDSLDAARELGFGTAWFSPDGERSDARGHDLLRRFDVDDDDVVTETVS